MDENRYSVLLVERVDRSSEGPDGCQYGEIAATATAAAAAAAAE